MSTGAPEGERAAAAEVEEAPSPPPRVPWYRWPTTQVRRLYDWTLSWAQTRYAVPALALLAFVEASFFPIPPDPLLMAMSFGKPKRGFYYALVCTIGSVAGGVAGWFIGMTVWRSLGINEACPEFEGGAWLFEYVPSFTCETFAIVQGQYQANAWLALFTAAFTPIPYKVFTVAGGVFEIALTTLIFASIVGRGARFFLVSSLIYFFGPQVRAFIEKRFELLTLVFTALLVGGFVAWKLL